MLRSNSCRRPKPVFEAPSPVRAQIHVYGLSDRCHRMNHYDRSSPESMAAPTAARGADREPFSGRTLVEARSWQVRRVNGMEGWWRVDVKCHHPSRAAQQPWNDFPWNLCRANHWFARLRDSIFPQARSACGNICGGTYAWRTTNPGVMIATNQL